MRWDLGPLGSVGVGILVSVAALLALSGMDIPGGMALPFSVVAVLGSLLVVAEGARTRRRLRHAGAAA